MINFKLIGKSYPFPTCWEDVTYRQYVALIRTASLTDHIHVFTSIPKDILEAAEIKGLEKISIAISFLSFSPHFDRTKTVGKYVLPKDCTIESLGQFEDLRALLGKMPQAVESIEDSEKIADLYLEACAIYCQKIRDKNYDYFKVAEVKEELKDCSCAEVIGTGAFFLFKPLNTSPPTITRFRKFRQRLRKWIQDLPGYQKTLDLLLPSSGSRGK